MYDSTSRSYCLSSNSPPECSAAPVSARPSDAPSPSGRVAATVLVLGLLLLWSTAEEAQTARIPFHSDILPARPALYFYGTDGQPLAAESVVDITGDLEGMEDGGLTVLTEMEPLGVLTISTHGRAAIWSPDRCG